MTESTRDRPGCASRVVGWFLIVSGGGWLGLLGWDFVQCYFELVPSSDIELAFWFPLACVTGPFVVGCVAVGLWLVAGGRGRTNGR
jgi:hypothetical protein